MHLPPLVKFERVEKTYFGFSLSLTGCRESRRLNLALCPQMESFASI